ncbi:MAG: hypothetical protein ACTSXL_05950 [Alphaproteobacteria bacterium]
MKKELNFYLFWGVFLLSALAWLKYVFQILPANPSFLQYAGVEKITLSLLLSLAFVPLFFVLVLVFLIFHSKHSKELSLFFKENKRRNSAMMMYLIDLGKSSGQLGMLMHSTQFFYNMNIRYQCFYDSLRRILRGIVVADSRLDSTKKEDLWSFCRSFLTQIARDPAMIEDIRRSLKKHEDIVKEFIIFDEEYNKFIKKLEKHDHDKEIHSMVKTGSLGRTHGLLKAIYKQAFPPVGKAVEIKKTNEIISSNTNNSLLSGLSIK